MENQNQICVSLVGGGIAYKGIDYHVNDFVYHHNHSGCAVLHIGQITQIISDQAGGISKLEVCQYGRYDDLAKRCAKSPTPLDSVCCFFYVLHFCNTNDTIAPTLQD